MVFRAKELGGGEILRVWGGRFSFTLDQCWVWWYEKKTGTNPHLSPVFFPGLKVGATFYVRRKRTEKSYPFVQSSKERWAASNLGGVLLGPDFWLERPQGHAVT